MQNGATGWDLVKYGLVGALSGGVSGAVGVGASVIVGMTALSRTVLGGAVIGASAGLTNGLISGDGFARLGGSSVGQALLSGLKKEPLACLRSYHRWCGTGNLKCMSWQEFLDRQAKCFSGVSRYVYFFTRLYFFYKSY